MKRLGLAVCVLGMVVSSCGVGVRQPATDITETSATLNGKAVSTIGGSGTYYFNWGPAENHSRPTPVRNFQYGADNTRSASEAVDQLVSGAVYRYRLCATDTENPGGGDGCSPVQTFRTLGPVAPTFHAENRDCGGPNDFSQAVFVVNFEPNTTYAFRAEFLEGATGVANTPFTTDDNGNAGIGSVGLNQPARARVLIWLNPDGDVTQDPGEETVLDEIYVVDEPCTGAHPEEPGNS